MAGICQNIYSKDNICFEILRYSLTADCDKSVLPYAVQIPELTKFFDRYFFDTETRKFTSYIEKYFPDEESVIESSGLYSGETDSGDWLDQVLFEMEEERLAAQIEALNAEGEILSQTLLNTYGDDLNPETVFTQKDSTLSSMEFENEVLVVEKNENGFIKITSNDKNTIREYYDLSYRLQVKETWEISSVENSKLSVKENFTYENESLKPSKKTVTSDEYQENFVYNSSGKTSSYRKYIILEKGNKLLEKQNWKFDSEDRIISHTKTAYTYKDKTYKKIEDTFEQKHTYIYNPWEDIPPDEEYYEDKILKQRTKYSETAGTYTVQYFFDNDFSIKTYYKNHEKSREVYTLNGEVWRVKDYEKQ